MFAVLALFLTAADTPFAAKLTAERVQLENTLPSYAPSITVTSIGTAGWLAGVALGLTALAIVLQHGTNWQPLLIASGISGGSGFLVAAAGLVWMRVVRDRRRPIEEHIREL